MLMIKILLVMVIDNKLGDAKLVLHSVGQKAIRESQGISSLDGLVFVFAFVYVRVCVFLCVGGPYQSVPPISPGSLRLRMASSSNQTICHWTVDTGH